jgi:hypothetical protein
VKKTTKQPAQKKKAPTKKSIKKPTRRRAAKARSQPQSYVMPKTAAELGIVCTGGNSGESCGLPVLYFDYEIGEKNHKNGFVCDGHKVSNRVEKLAQPTAASNV